MDDRFCHALLLFRLTPRKWTPTFSQQQLRHADVIVTDELVSWMS
jgi:hypothetical protein